jgi:hypothetical protein
VCGSENFSRSLSTSPSEALSAIGSLLHSRGSGRGWDGYQGRVSKGKSAWYIMHRSKGILAILLEVKDAVLKPIYLVFDETLLSNVATRCQHPILV